jgi:hypothetical protein
MPAASCKERSNEEGLARAPLPARLRSALLPPDYSFGFPMRLLPDGASVGRTDEKKASTFLRRCLSSLLVMVSACSPDYAVRLRAEGDLSCPDDKIQVEGGPIDYVARGCGRAQDYRCATNNNSRYCWKR